MDAEERLALAKRLWEWEPHPGQREFLTLRLEDGSEPKVLVAACGRRWGKTECLGMDIAARILTEPDLGQMGVAPTRDQAETLFDSVEEKLRAAMESPEAAARFPHLGSLEIRHAPYPLVRRKDTGQMVFWVRAAGRKGRNLRGRGTTRKLKRFRVIVDERAFVDDAAVEEAIKPMLATVPDGGGQLVEIGSPYGKRGGFYADFLRGERQERRCRAVRLPSSQNPLVDPEYLEAMREEMTPCRFAAEFLAEFIDAAGTVFPDEDVRAATCDDDYGAAPLWGARYVAGVDLGRRQDWTVVCVLDVTAVPVRLVALWRVQGIGWQAQAAQIVDLLARWGCRRVACDATGVGDSVTEDLQRDLLARRLPCALERVTFTASSKGYLIDGLAVALARRRLRLPPHPALLSELANFEATPTATGHERLEAARDGHDDCVCALALALRAAAPYLPLAPGIAPVRLGRAGRRPAFDGSDSEEKEFTWDGLWTEWHGSRGASGRSPAAAGALLERLGRRSLATVYRFAPARQAGASWYASIAARTRPITASIRRAG